MIIFFICNIASVFFNAFLQTFVKFNLSMLCLNLQWYTNLPLQHEADFSCYYHTYFTFIVGNNFFSNSSLGITGISDPHVRFDRLSGRWFVVAIDVDHNTNNYCCIAVSDGPTVTSNSSFKIYYFNTVLCIFFFFHNHEIFSEINTFK